MYQTKKEPISVEEKSEFDAIADSNFKPLDHRLGISPEKLEKKAAAKKGPVFSTCNSLAYYIFCNRHLNNIHSFTINRIEAINIAIQADQKRSEKEG